MPRDLTDLEARLKPEVFSLEGLIAWLAMQPREQTYNWRDCQGACLIGLYLAAHGHKWEGNEYCRFSRIKVPAFTAWDKPTMDMGMIACFEPHTFGAAYDRASKSLAGIGAMLGGR